MPTVTIVGAAGAAGAAGSPISPISPIRVEARPGDSLFDAAARVSAGVDTACVGKGTCGLCRVKILAGAEHLNPYTDEERKHLGNVYHITKVRLSCRCRPTGDVTIEIVRKKK